jgi:LysR family transcriptional activator of nhaA
MNFKHLQYFWTVARSGGVLRAAERLHVTPQTISGQLQLLEERLGRKLFRKQGRRLELTEDGRTALRYADEIFSLGEQLEEALARGDGGRAIEFRVGVADAVAKSLAYRLIEPAAKLPDVVRMVCREGKMEVLLSELAIHRLDLVIANVPMPASFSVQAFNHKLGESGVSFFAAPALASRCKGRFPANLSGMPLLLPGHDSPLAARLQRWLERESVTPRIVGEFDDSALMKAFGQNGQGIFVGSTALEREVRDQYGVRVLGRTDAVREEFFAISVERRLSHPCVIAITDKAREDLFTQPAA